MTASYQEGKDMEAVKILEKPAEINWDYDEGRKEFLI